MFTREGDRTVCREFTQKGIYQAVTALDNGTVIYCTDRVIEEFEALVSINVRIRRAVGVKNITLQKLLVEKKQPKRKEKPPERVAKRKQVEAKREEE